MSKSKNRPGHREKVNQFKNKIKKQQSMNQNQMPRLPEVRNVPVWEPNADISVKGFEWEAIQNGLTATQMALQAAQSVMSRNILNGNITMDFEKLNASTMQYEPMTAEESAPHVDEFTKQVEAFKTAQTQAPVEKTPEVSPTDDASATKTAKKGKLVDMKGKDLADKA